jgi:hypothetical protein
MLGRHTSILTRNELSGAARSRGANPDESSMGERLIKTLFIYSGAALPEIGGCFAFWIWLRSGHS